MEIESRPRYLLKLTGFQSRRPCGRSQAADSRSRQECLIRRLKPTKMLAVTRHLKPSKVRVTLLPLCQRFGVQRLGVDLAASCPRAYAFVPHHSVHFCRIEDWALTALYVSQTLVGDAYFARPDQWCPAQSRGRVGAALCGRPLIGGSPIARTSCSQSFRDFRGAQLWLTLRQSLTNN
jgi:hypothetical protein